MVIGRKSFVQFYIQLPMERQKKGGKEIFRDGISVLRQESCKVYKATLLQV